MAGADVREIDAVRDWLAALKTFREAAENSIVGTDQEIRRGYDWIEDQLKLWQKSLKDDEERVHLAKMELSGRQIPNHDGKYPDTTLQKRNLNRAIARRDHTEEKIDQCRRWLSKLPKAIDESYTGSARRLQGLLEAELPKACLDLDRRIAALEAYAGMKMDYSPAPSMTTTTAASSENGSGTTANANGEASS
ncbi:MAG: hypothetical protein U0798_05800 [Gemmataceae bacterium]